MKKLRLIFIFLFITVAALFAVGCSTAEYAGGHSAPPVNRNEVMPIERNRLSLALGMEIDEFDVIEKSGCRIIDSNGKEIIANAQTLTDGTFTYDHFELDTVGLNKYIKITYGDTSNYIFYDVYDYTVNFFTDENSDEPWKTVRASAQLNDELWLSVWVDINEYNYSTDELAREADPDGAKLFKGWFDYGDNAATGYYVLQPPATGTERVLNLYAHYMDEDEFKNYDITYDGSGRRVFNKYIGEKTDTVVIPEGVTYIDLNTLFGDGFNFENLHIPASAQIDVPVSNAIYTLGLKDITVDKGSYYFSSYNGALYSDDYEILYLMPASCENTQFHDAITELGSYSCAYWQVSEVTIPKGLTHLDHYCFAYSQLSKINGMINVSTIMSGVFYKTKISSIDDGTAQYTVLDNGQMILSYVYGKPTEYTVASGTVAIVGDAFNKHSQLKSITFPDGLESIGSSAFSECTALESVQFPSSLKHMGSHVFYGCRSLKTVSDIPDLTFTDDDGDVYSHALPAYIFYGCSSLTEIKLPDGLRMMMSYALRGCSNITEIEIPETVYYFGHGVFYNTGITSIDLPAGLRYVGQSCFYGSKLESIDLSVCTSLTALSNYCFAYTKLEELTIPAWITDIPRQCFAYISTLKELDLGSVVSLDYGAFYQSSLADIGWGDSIQSIGELSFGGTTTLTSIVIPDTVTSIAYRAFGSCSKIRSITLGKSVRTLGNYTYLDDGVTFDKGNPAFFGLQNLRTISVSEDNPYFKVVDGVLYGRSICGIDYGENGVLYYVPPYYGEAEIILPDSVKIIIPYAFMYQKSISEVNTNDGLLNIGKAAFYASTSLTTLNLSKSVNNIGANIFYSCRKVNTFTVAEGNEKYSTDGNLVYAGDTLVMYLAFSPNVVIRDGITAIADAVFMGNTVIESIVIPDSVISIGYKTFDGCSALTSIKIGKGLENIDDWSFGALKSLETITVSDDNENFKTQDNILYSKDGRKLILSAAKNVMTELKLESGVTEIGDWAFAYNTTLTSVRLPVGIRSIGNYAFYECRALTEFYGSEALLSIGERAFSFEPAPTDASNDAKKQLCNTLKTVMLYGSVENIGASAFYGQFGLENLYLKMTLAQYNDMLAGCGTNIGFLTRGCTIGSTNEYTVNDGKGVIRALYSETKPTITYDGYEMFYLDGDEPKMWEL
ncbi:MAG: leucine-rich repeat protein [Clostridiales bacterium]|nr:leucine-rich repeat protein [Clostridiales bacterium]